MIEYLIQDTTCLNKNSFSRVGIIEYQLQIRMLQTNDFFTPLTNEREIITALEDWSRVCLKRTRNLNSLWLNMTFCAKLIRFQVSLALEVLGANPREEEVLVYSYKLFRYLFSLAPQGVLARVGGNHELGEHRSSTGGEPWQSL